MSKRIEVVAAIIHENGKIFATQRGYGNYRHKWEFPGGKIEPGERPEEALAREIREELETEICVGELAGTVEYDYPEFHLCMRCYLCTIVSGDLTLVEHESAKWLDRNDMFSVDWLPADIEIIEKLQNMDF